MRGLTGNFGTSLDEVRGRTELGVFKSIKVTRAPDVARYLFTHTLAAEWRPTLRLNSWPAGVTALLKRKTEKKKRFPLGGIGPIKDSLRRAAPRGALDL